jgi:hypothetical protein
MACLRRAKIMPIAAPTYLPARLIVISLVKWVSALKTRAMAARRTNIAQPIIATVTDSAINAQGLAMTG